MLTQAASALHISKSEFIRRNIIAYGAQMWPKEQNAADIDALYLVKVAACEHRFCS